MESFHRFAVLQSEETPPTADQLKRVFKEFVHLTDADAVRVAFGARGILMRRLRRDVARALQRTFQAEGVSVAVVDERDLPELPDGHALHRLGIWPQAFTVYDLRGKSHSIAWPEIALIAAGAGREAESRTGRDRRALAPLAAGSGMPSKRSRESGRAPQPEPGLWLEILLRGGAGRYQLDAAKFTFRYVIDRPGLSVEEKFIWLTREICRQSTRAVFNSGAARLIEGDETVPSYLNHQALTDEIIWMLWREAKS